MATLLRHRATVNGCYESPNVLTVFEQVRPARACVNLPNMSAGKRKSRC